MVERQTDVNVDTGTIGTFATADNSQKEEGFMGKFMNLLSGEEASKEAFNRTGLVDK